MLKKGLGKYFLLQKWNNKYKNMLKFYQICAAGKKTEKISSYLNIEKSKIKINFMKVLIETAKNLKFIYYIIKNNNAKSYCDLWL